VRPGQGIAPLQALIYLSARLHQPVEHVWWERISGELREHAPSQTDVDALIFLYRCQKSGDCPHQPAELLDAFVAALAKSEGNVNLMEAYGEFALLELHDAPLAERMYRDVVTKRPQVAVYRANLVEFLIATNRFDEARETLDGLRTMNHLGALDTTIARLEEKLQQARGSARSAQPQTDPPATGDAR